MKTFVELAAHAPDCYAIAAIRAKRRGFPASPWTIDRQHVADVQRDAIGRSTGHRITGWCWLRWKCRGRNCEAVILVREDHVLALLQQAGGPGPLTATRKRRSKT
jgi:hypothetical protein